MKDENDKTTPFPARLLTVALLLTGLMLVTMLWFAFDSYREIATVQRRNLRVEELCGTIVHLDEVLTMSARMAAATGDSNWEQRYRQFEPQLDGAMKEVMLLTARSVSADAAAQTDAANLKMIEMENRSFALIRAGEAGQAKAVMFSDAYEEQKKIYAKGEAQLVQHLKEHVAANLRKKQRQAIFSIVAVVLCIVFLFLTWVSVLRRLRHWRTRQFASLEAVTRAEEMVRKLNDGLEKRVEDRTRSLESEIRERKLGQEQLAASEHRLRLILESEPECVKLVSEDGTLLEINPAGLRMIEAEHLEQAMGQSVYGFVAPEHHALFRSLNESIFRGESVIAEFEIIGFNGTHRWMETHACPLRDMEGRIFAQLGVSRDITQRRKTEAELVKTHKELLETSRQVGMAEVATGVLHNVGNVLNSVNVSSTLVANNIRKSKAANLAKVVKLLGEHESDLGEFFSNNPKGKQLPAYLAQLATHLADEQSEAIEELAQLQQNIEHIKGIVAMQQSFSKVSGATETLNVTDLVEDALRMNANSFNRHDVQVIKEFKPVPSVTVEKHKVLQILVNLVSNAKHACNDSGRHKKQLTIGVSHQNDATRITVSDNGVGIPVENLTRIFAHGFTTKSNGHGFGLHSCALVAKELGGSLQARSDGLGHGATFTLELPVNIKSADEQTAYEYQ